MLTLKAPGCQIQKQIIIQKQVPARNESRKQKEKETEIVKKHTNGTRKIRNLIAERGGQAVGDEEGTMGWGSGGRRRDYNGFGLNQRGCNPMER